MSLLSLIKSNKMDSFTKETQKRWVVGISPENNGSVLDDEPKLSCGLNFRGRIVNTLLKLKNRGKILTLAVCLERLIVFFVALKTV
jgi:hypothetical protein